MSASQRSSTHLTALDGLRGVAALIVVTGHSALEGFLPGLFGGGFGQVGVAAFYSLSGFLMAFLYLHRPFDAGTIRAYLVARGARVLPLYYVVVIGCCLLLVVAGTSLYGIMDAADAASTLFLVQGTGVFWSIPVEIHYYLLFLLVWWGAATGRLALVAGGLLAVELALYAADLAEGIGSRWVLLWLHAFVAGSLMGWWFQRRGSDQAPPSAILHAIAWASLPLLLLMPPGVRGALGLPIIALNIDPLTAGLPIFALWCAALGLGPYRVLSWEPLRRLGGVSFGIYLLHVPVLIVARELGPWIGGVPLAQYVFSVMVSIALAMAALHLVERPAQAWLRARLAPSRPAPVTSRRARSW